jgi:hypothetical protein
MKLNRTMLGISLSLALMASGVVIAQQPVQNVNPNHHGNIAAAQHLTEQAYNKVVAAQQANEFDMNGHAAKAKDLLEQANRELKAAAETANKNQK